MRSRTATKVPSSDQLIAEYEARRAADFYKNGGLILAWDNYAEKRRNQYQAQKASSLMRLLFDARRAISQSVQTATVLPTNEDVKAAIALAKREAGVPRPAKLEVIRLRAGGDQHWI